MGVDEWPNDLWWQEHRPTATESDEHTVGEGVAPENATEAVRGQE